MPTGSRALPTTQEQQVSSILRDAMVARSISQGVLADLIGISQPQLSKILSGTRVMTLPEMLRACDALGLVASDVLRRAGF